MRGVGSSRRRGLLSAVLVAGLALLPGARPAAGKQPEGVPATLRVGIAPIYPPLAFKDGDQLKGIEVDFANRLGKALGTKVTFVQLPWDDLIPALNGGKVDLIMSGMSITPERSQLVDFTMPYLRVGQMAILRAGDADKFRDAAVIDLGTTRVGFLNNTTGERYARRELKSAQLTGFASVDDGVAALKENKIDLFIMDAPTVWRLTTTRGTSDPALTGRYQPLTTEYLAWAVSKKNPALLQRLNQVLIGWHDDGAIDDVLDDWITVRKVTYELTPSQ